jgi:hypothetical protein
VDWVGVLESWVEKNAAPAEIAARRLDSAGATLAERRLCAHPQVARLQQGGDANSASGYRCAD